MSACPCGGVEVRVEVRPRWHFRLPSRGGLDGLVRVRGGVLTRLLCVDGEPVHVRVAQRSADRVLFGAWASTRSVALEGIGRMRFALGVDLDLRPFYERFCWDGLIGASVRARPWLRVAARPDPFEALTFAICEQLIEYERAASIQRRLISLLGRRCAGCGLRDAPDALAVSGCAPARLEACGLSGGRALALRRAGREVAAGRVAFSGPGVADGWRRLRAIPGIGSWTVQTLALSGQGRLDVLPAGDLAYLKLVGRLLTGGDPYARAGEEEVSRFFARFGEWRGLAGVHALRGAGSGAALRLAA